MTQKPVKKRYCKNEECGVELTNPESNGTRYCSDDCRPYHAKYHAKRKENQHIAAEKKEAKKQNKINPYFLKRGNPSDNCFSDVGGSFVG